MNVKQNKKSISYSGDIFDTQSFLTLAEIILFLLFFGALFVCLFVCLFLVFWFFSETGILYVALAVLELTL